MSNNCDKSTKKLSNTKFNEIKNRVDNYLQHGGIITPNRNIYLNYPETKYYISYSQYQNMLNRWTAFITKYNREPNSIQIYKQSTNIGLKAVAIPLSTFKDMKSRVEKYILDGGNITNTRAIYLDYITQTEYVTYSVYCNMLKRYNDFVKKNNREPKTINTNIETIKTVTTSNKDCYINPRYYSNGEMKQDTIYYCGVNITQQIIYSLTGKYYSESNLAKMLGTTKKGTTPEDIVVVLKKILKSLGHNVKRCEWVNKNKYSWKDIGEMLEDKKISIAFHDKYKLQYGHYEVISKLCVKGQYMVVLNSLSGGYFEKRTFKTMQSYLDALYQPSLLIVEIV